MALKISNKSRKSNIKDPSWEPLYNIAQKETELDVEEVSNMWKPLHSLAPKETEETLKKFIEETGVKIEW